MSHVLRRNVKRLVQQFYPTVEIKIIYSCGFKISNMFNFKDTLPLSCKSGVVYFSQCKKCGPSMAYLGKTKNTLHERFFLSGSGHLNDRNNSSVFLDHLLESDDPECEFCFEDIKIIDTCDNDYRLRTIPNESRHHPYRVPPFIHHI